VRVTRSERSMPIDITENLGNRRKREGAGIEGAKDEKTQRR